MGQFLIDSNVVIDYLGGKLPNKGTVFVSETINSTPIIWVMTKIEVLGFRNSESDNEVLTDFISSSVVIELTDEITDLTIALRKL